MSDNKIFFREPDGSIAKIPGFKFLVGRVKDIVLGPLKGDGSRDPNYVGPVDIGRIEYEIMYSNFSMSNVSGLIQPAYPMFAFIKQYPLLGEIVYIVPGPDSNLNDGYNRQGYWYFPPYNVWNSPHHNIFPNMSEYAKFVLETNAKTASRDKSKMVAIPTGNTFTEQKDVRTLRPFEGDTIFESRFGQSIRFGSTVKGAGTGTNQLKLNSWSDSGRNGNPIVIIRNGQGVQETNDYFDTTVENIDTCDASIWMTSDQVVVPKEIANGLYSFASYPGNTKAISTIITETTRESADLAGSSARDLDINSTSTLNIV